MLKDVVDVKPLDGYRLYLRFEDGAQGEVDVAELITFTGVFAALRDKAVFDQVRVDPEVHTLVWPNDADFDPATLYYWNEGDGAELAERAQGWEQARVAPGAGE